MSLKPITIWFNPGPNPPKIVMVCEELGIPYEKVQVGDVKAESFTKINPNGRVPAIKDPNNGDLVLWESGAIVEYLVDTYDKDHKISIASGADKWHLRQYLHFQVSGQGPYYGQAVWFHRYHAEQVESAKERYLGQIERVWGVLDNILKDKQYLVGDKYTYADLAFTPWEYGMHGFFAAETKHLECEKKYPHYWAWYQRLIARPSFKAAYGQ